MAGPAGAGPPDAAPADDAVTASRRPPKVDLRVEQAKVRRQSLVATLVCGVTLVGLTLGLPSWIAFPQGADERIGLVLRADVFVALWVVFGVRMIGKIRFQSAEDNAGSAFRPPSARLAVPAAFLQNTLEQALLAVVAHLALATVEGDWPLAYVVASVGLFGLGRLTFLLGYPHGAGGRAFGMVTTVLPTIGAYGWVIFAMIADLAAVWP